MSLNLAAIAESAGDAIIGYDLSGVIQAWNRPAETLFGYSREEIIGVSVSVLMPPESSQGICETLALVKQGHSRTQDTFRRHKQGHLVAVSLTDSPVLDQSGAIVGASKIARDIRAHKAELEAEIAVRKQAEERLRLVIEAAPNALIMCAADGRIVLINSQTEKMFGYDRDELLGHPIERLVPSRWRNGHGAERAGFFANPSARTMGSGRDLFGLRKDGIEIPIEIGLNPLATHEGNFVLASVIDITERKRIEKTLAAAKAEVEFRNRDLETLLHVTSHDLREPLRAIQNFSLLLSDRYAGQLDEKGNDLLMRVRRGSKRLDTLLQDILNVSRARSISPPNELLSGRKIVADAIGALNARILETHATVHVADNFPDIRVSLMWGSLAVQNLLNNALKFTPANVPPEVEICGYQNEAAAETGIVVRDRGIGVAPQHAERIFELFQRAVGREIEGTGAGLAIVRQIAERHGGRAEVRPRDGGGSQFLITFKQQNLQRSSAAGGG